MPGIKPSELPADVLSLFREVYQLLDQIAIGFAAITEGNMRIAQFATEEIRLILPPHEDQEFGFDRLRKFEFVEYNFEKSILDSTIHIRFHSYAIIEEKMVLPLKLEYEGQVVDCSRHSVGSTGNLDPIGFDLEAQVEACEVMRDYLRYAVENGVRLRGLR